MTRFIALVGTEGAGGCFGIAITEPFKQWNGQAKMWTRLPPPFPPHSILSTPSD
jgi:hypothetical protein